MLLAGKPLWIKRVMSNLEMTKTGKSYIKENTENILEMISKTVKDRILLAENDAIKFECETDAPGQLCFHYSIKRWAPSAFKIILHDWEIVKNELKNIGVPCIWARAKIDDIQNLKLFKMTGFIHYQNLVTRDGTPVYYEYKLEL